MYLDPIFSESLCLPSYAISYHVSRRLTELFPGRAIVEGYDCDFQVEEYARANLCALDAEGLIHHQVQTSWHRERGLMTKALNAWFEVSWRGHSIDLILMDWEDG